jgi:hypothetical protein
MSKPLPPLDYLRSVLECRDGVLYNKVARSTHAVQGKRSGSLSNCGYYRISINSQKYLEHRIVYYMVHGECPEYLDHIDGNKQNNQIENLRPTTVAQNMCNTGNRADNTSGVKGVSWSKVKSKWTARVQLHGKVKCGYFDDKQMAVGFVKTLREQYHDKYTNHGKNMENLLCL